MIVVAWKARPGMPLVVAANRDEWRERPTQPAHWWPDHPDILAGRDLEAGGTWMGVARSGRFAAVTNFRDPSDKRSTARSRGELVADFLATGGLAETWLATLSRRAHEYNGFNLIVGDGERLWYFGSRGGEAREIEPGIHGLSNHLLDEPWPKVIRGRLAMDESMDDADPSVRLFAMLADGRGAPDEALPDTGVGIAWERRLAAPLITGADYGTRSSTVLWLRDDGSGRFEERSLGPDGHVTGVRVEDL